MNILATIFLGLIMVICAMFDLKTNRIPNFITYPSMLIAFSYYGISNGLVGLAFSGSGLLVGIGLFIIPYLMGGMGAGDAKLMGVVGAVLGVKGVFITALFTALVGGIYAVIILIVNPSFSKGFIHKGLQTLKFYIIFKEFIPIPETKGEKAPKLCYGVAIALGTLIYLSLETVGYKIFT